MTKVKSIRTSLLLTLGIGMLVVTNVMMFAIAKMVFERNTEQITKSIVTMTEKRADSIELQMQEMVYSAEAVSGLFGGSWAIPEKKRRSALEQQLRSFVKNSTINSAWAYWVPKMFDAFDDKHADPIDNPTGQFMMHYIKDKNGRIKNDIISELSQDEIQKYAQDKSTHISEPKEILLDEEKVLTAKVFSRLTNSVGQDVGVAGIDIVLANLASMVDGTEIYNGTVCSFLSTTGSVMASTSGESTGSKSKFFIDEKLKKLITNNDSDTELKTNYFQTNTGSKTMLVAVSKIKVDRTSNIWYFISETPMNEINKASFEIIRIILAAFMIQIALVLVMIFAGATRISRPLKLSVSALKNISEGDGDLTVRLKEDQRYEIGEMCVSFNKTMHKIGHSIRDVKKSTVQMEEIGEDLHSSMDMTSKSIGDITESIQSIQSQVRNNASGVQEAKNVVDQIVRNIEVLNNNIDKQSLSVSQSSSSIEEMTANIASVSKILEKNHDSMISLEHASEKGMQLINNTTELSQKIQGKSKNLTEASAVIKKIASETNLLAMNAAIEAAHAGDSGQGFSVVAGEIRSLAEESSLQGSKIQNAILEVQSIIEEISKSTSSVQQQFNNIFSLTKTVAQQEEVIDHAMQEQNAGGEQILNAMHEITTITENVKNGSIQMMEGSRLISSQMDNIASMTSSVNENMQNMTEKAESIISCARQADDCVAKNVQSIAKLKKAMDKFKVE